MTRSFTKRARITRAVASLVTIIVGVLMALAANAWWEGRHERTRGHIYLEMLRVDLEATDSLIDASLAQDRRTLDSSQRMAEVLLAGSSWSQLPQSVKPHFGLDDAWFRTGTVTALLATGDINNIRSDTLRSALVRYADEVNFIRSSLSRTETASWANVRDYVRAEEELFQTARDPDLKRRLVAMSSDEALRSFDLRRIREHPGIAAAFRLHAITVANRMEVLQQSKAPVEELLRLLDDELGAGGEGGS